jgi:DNA-binding NarL/FixJ family response regulator
MTSASALRILIVNDHEIVRRGLARLMERWRDFQVVGEAATAAEATERAAQLYPDVVVLDLHLPDASAVQVCREIRSRNPRIRVLLLTSYEDDEAVIGAILGGAAGYLRKEVRSQDIVDAVRKVARGQSLLDHGIRERVLERVRRGTQEGLGRLTRLEEEILGHVSSGKTNSEVAAAVFLSEEVVRSSVSTLLEKLEATRRSQAAAYMVAWRTRSSR